MRGIAVDAGVGGRDFQQCGMNVVDAHGTQFRGKALSSGRNAMVVGGNVPIRKGYFDILVFRHQLAERIEVDLGGANRKWQGGYGHGGN